MPFAYYNRLTRRQQSIYRASDEIESLRLRDPKSIADIAAQLEAALEAEDQKSTARICNALVTEICIGPGVPTVRVRVLRKRPSTAREELHGQYERTHSNRANKPAEITVWMRTARRNQVVAFRTFLRTLLHELCHHLDYEFLKLEDSFHTEGFFKRESSLFKQIVRN